MKKQQKSKTKSDVKLKGPLTKSTRIISRSSKGSVAILHLDQDQVYYEVDGVALEFWNMINGKKTAGDLKEQLQKKYPGYDQKIEGLVTSWLNDFKKYDLLA